MKKNSVRENSYYRNLQRALRLVLDLLFPISCLGCGKPSLWICEECLKKIEISVGNRHALPAGKQGCSLQKHTDRIVVATDYTNPLIRQAIHFLKYKYVRELAKPLGKLMKHTIPEISDPSIIPVPLHPKRLRDRGFNQSELLAHELGLSVDSETLTRIRHTEPQMKLDRKNRLNNLTDAFELVSPESIKGRNIILVDDVLTTGSTIKECTKTLRKGHPKSITALILAHGE